MHHLCLLTALSYPGCHEDSETEIESGVSEVIVVQPGGSIQAALDQATIDNIRQWIFDGANR